MTGMMTKRKLLDLIRAERAQWDALLAQVDQARMTEPGMAGDWSLKDIIAHVAWCEREVLGVLRAHAMVGSDLWNLSNDERNAAVYVQNRERSLHDVLSEAREVYPQLIEAVEALTEEDITDPTRFRDMPSEWRPWMLISNNTYEHYQAHTPSIRAWLEQSKL
jgi:uncharacterized protein (TIGR03083 family)